MWVEWANVVRLNTRGPDGAWRRGYVVSRGRRWEARP